VNSPLFGLTIGPPKPQPTLLEQLAPALVCFGMGLVPLLLLVIVAILAQRRRRNWPRKPDLPPDEPAPDLRLPDRSPKIQRDQEPRS
jgi:hypothetical protein